MLESSGMALPIKLRAAVQPLYLDRYRALFDGLLEIWSSLGVQVEIVTSDFESFIATYTENENVDVRIMRWAGDYDDADNFTYGLFHSGSGLLSRYFSSPDTDKLVEEGRGERNPSARETTYRRFENVLAESGTLLPLFHEIDYRLANPYVRGMELRSRSPFVNYAETRKVRACRPEHSHGHSGRHAARAGPRRGPHTRANARCDGGTERGSSGDLRDADATGGRGAGSALARFAHHQRTGRPALSDPAEGRRPIPRRPPADSSRCPLFSGEVVHDCREHRPMVLHIDQRCRGAGRWLGP